MTDTTDWPLVPSGSRQVRGTSAVDASATCAGVTTASAHTTDASAQRSGSAARGAWTAAPPHVGQTWLERLYGWLIGSVRHLDRVRSNLYIGDIEAGSQPELRTAAGITHVICCLPQLPESLKGKPDVLHLPMHDNESQDLLTVLPTAVAFLRAAIAKGGTVLVHCRCGKSRSAAIVTGYLMVTERRSCDDALWALAAARAIIDPNSNFRSALIEWGRRNGIG